MGIPNKNYQMCEIMSDKCLISLEDLETLSAKFPSSYFEAMRNFAKMQEKECVEIDMDDLLIVTMGQTDRLKERIDRCVISSDDMTRVMLRNIMELNRNSQEILQTYIPEIIRLKMYEEFQEYIFSQLGFQAFIDIYEKYKTLFTPEFLTGFPYLSKDLCTVLTCMIIEHNESLCLRLVEMNNTNLGQVDDYGCTALILACYYGLSKLALKILEMDKSNPGQIDIDGDTALICACNKNLSEVALKILETGKGNPHHVNKNGNSALSFAIKNNLRDVISCLNRCA